MPGRGNAQGLQRCLLLTRDAAPAQPGHPRGVVCFAGPFLPRAGPDPATVLKLPSAAAVVTAATGGVGGGSASRVLFSDAAANVQHGGPEPAADVVRVLVAVWRPS